MRILYNLRCREAMSDKELSAKCAKPPVSAPWYSSATSTGVLMAVLGIVCRSWVALPHDLSAWSPKCATATV